MKQVAQQIIISIKNKVHLWSDPSGDVYQRYHYSEERS